MLLDLGTFSTDPVDHPGLRARRWARPCCAASSRRACSSAAAGWAPPSPPTRSAASALRLCHDPEAARLAREEDDANVLCLGAREVDPIRAVAIAMAWLGASFSGEERFARKISKITLLEGGLPAAEKAPPARPRPRPPRGHLRERRRSRQLPGRYPGCRRKPRSPLRRRPSRRCPPRRRPRHLRGPPRGSPSSYRPSREPVA